MTAKHTPGPWNASETGHCVWEPNGHRVATVHGRGKPDARLIAAAPELLACLLDVLDADGDLYAMDFGRYRAAIAAATGEGE